MRRIWGLLALALLGSLLVAPMAAAQDEDDGSQGNGAGLEFLQIQGIDSRNPSGVQMTVGWSGPAGALEAATITENGSEVTVSGVESTSSQPTLMVLAIDNSEAMSAGDALTRTKRALVELVENRPPGQNVGVVSFGGGSARVVLRPTDNTERLVSTIEDLGATGTSATWAGLDAAARMITDAGRRGPHSHVVVVSAGASTGTVSGQRARGALISSGASTWAVTFEDRGVNREFMRHIVNGTGGAYFGVVNIDAAVSALGEVSEHLNSRYVITYASDQRGPVDLSLTVGGQTTEASYISGSNLFGATAVAPAEVIKAGGVGFLRENGRLIGLVLVVAAVVLAAYAVGMLVAPDRSGLDSALEVYTEGPGGSTAIDDDDDGSGLARTALIQRAVGITEGFAERQGFLAKAEARLEQADLPLRAAEALFFYGAGVLLVLGMAFALTNGNLLGTLIATGLIALVPISVVNFLAKRRQKKFNALLPDTLQLLAGTLRAGYSLMQGVEAVSREVSEPMGKELRRVVTEARLGRPLEESLDASAQRMESPDFAWAVMAIRIQREVGGNLAELLMTVADTMTQRERLRRDVNSLTAEGRVSAMVLGLLPVGLGVMLYLGNPTYIGVLFEERMGQFMLVGAVILAGFGFWWMKKVIEVDI